MSTPPLAKLPAHQRLRRVGAFAAIALVSIAAVLLWRGDHTAERAAIRDLPPAERLALYERTRNTVANTCDPKVRPSGLADFCHEQALLLTHFSECDAACMELARGRLPKATR